jgi:hypothetical protein
MSDIFNGIHSGSKKGAFKLNPGPQGHSLGCALFGEEYPFIGRTNTGRLSRAWYQHRDAYYRIRNQTFNIEDTFPRDRNGHRMFHEGEPKPLCLTEGKRKRGIVSNERL